MTETTKTACIFPGQASQFPGMGKDLYEASADARELFDLADDILGLKLSDVMFNGTEEDLRQTNVTQPSVFVHSVVKARMMGDDFRPAAVAGHSLGEFSALVTAEVLDFISGLKLVNARANAMQRACEQNPGTMAAIVGLEDEVIEEVCQSIEGVVPANYNCPGQLVISGTVEGINNAVEALNARGAKRAIVLAVGGAFHSPLMEPARNELSEAINNTNFREAKFPVYQNVTAKPVTTPDQIRENLILQLTAPVKWTQIMQNMVNDGIVKFVEVGGRPGVLAGFVRKLDRSIPVESI